MTYPDAIAYLDSLAQFGWKLDLARIQRLCELAEHPERRFPSVLIGGSAGKGSTVAILAAILREAGLRVGTAPKPHLITHRERVQVNGELISEARFAELMARIVPLAEQVTREEGSPTVFEVMTLLAFLQFSEEAVDVAVVEVGLGGRFDATNVLTPELAVITMIGLDHTDRLGSTVEEIAFEKAGILKPGGRVVTGAQGGALSVIQEIARERGVAVQSLGEEIRLSNVCVEPGGTRFDLALKEGEFPGLCVSLEGEHQARNAALAVAAAVWLRDVHPQLTEGAIRGGLARVSVPGRLQTLRRQPLLLLDGAHSPDRADALADTLRRIYLRPEGARRLFLVLGCSTGHEPSVVTERLAPLAERVIATRSKHFAAVPAEALVTAAEAVGAATEVVLPVAEAVRRALELAEPDDVVLVTGSLFVVGEALEAVQAAEPR